MDFFEQLEKGRYGSFELKRQVGPNLVKGLLISLLIHGTVLASPFIIAKLFLNGEAIPPPPSGLVYLDKPPALVSDEPNPPKQVNLTVSQPAVAKFKRLVPVPQGMEDTTLNIAIDQKALKRYLGGPPIPDPGAGDGTGKLVLREPPPAEDSIPDPKAYQPVEIFPQVLAGNPQPVYPEIARIGGMQGKVVVQVYVDKRGEVKRWQIQEAKPTGLGFEDEVLKVIPKWKFTPGVQNGKAVGVWVSIPFRFRLNK